MEPSISKNFTNFRSQKFMSSKGFIMSVGWGGSHSHWESGKAIRTGLFGGCLIKMWKLLKKYYLFCSTHFLSLVHIRFWTTFLRALTQRFYHSSWLSGWWSVTPAAVSHLAKINNTVDASFEKTALGRTGVQRYWDRWWWVELPDGWYTNSVKILMGRYHKFYIHWACHSVSRSFFHLQYQAWKNSDGSWHCDSLWWRSH